MLDWQNKKWIKVMAVILVITFLSYDIAWATDFSPLHTATNTATTPGFLPKIGNFISEHILKRTSKAEKAGETEVSFRSQLVPTKKYEEQSGFMRLEAVREMIKRQLDDLNRRQNIEVDRNKAIYNQYQINRSLYMQDTEKGQSVQAIQNQVMKARGDTMEAAAAGGEFSYTMNKDGSRVNYTDGLPSSIQNERITDSYGYVSIKNTKNMQYNSQRMLTSYSADILDPMGNATRVSWYDAVYSSDSVWWASNETNAGKYLLGYKEMITDAYGTVTMREWSTTKEGYDAARKVINYHEVLKDGLGNVVSTSDWSKGVYDGDKVKSYHQVTKDAYGNVSALDWEGEYNDNNFITKTFSKETQTNRDHSTSYSENTSLYTYENGNLKTAVGNGTFKAEDEYGNVNSGTTLQQYEVINGQIKLVRNITNAYYENIDGSTANSESTVTYFYGKTNLLEGAEGRTTTEGTDIFGNGYMTVTIDTYDTIASQTRRTKSVSINEAEDLFGSINHSETINIYKYNEITGDLVLATGYTDTIGEDIFGNKSVTHADHTYQIINGQPKLVRSETMGDLVNPLTDLGQVIGDIQTFLEGYSALPTLEAKQAKLQEVGLQGLGLDLVDLSTAGVTRIVGWLWKASTRLINCAINSIYNILSKFGITVTTATKKEILQKTILIDILIGVITPETATGELMLSMYSMMKTAASKGVSLQGAMVNISQLKSIGQPVIAYVGGDHYIIIKSIDDSVVSYIDGLEEKTMAVSEFLSVWGGTILTPAVPQGANVLDVGELKKITGADYTDPDDQPSSDLLPDDPPSGWTPDYPDWKPEGAGADDSWSDASHWAWHWNGSSWESQWVVEYTISWEVGENRYSTTVDENGETEGEFIKEDVNGYRHVKQTSTSDGVESGFELWRKLDEERFSYKDIYYHTWGKDGESYTRLQGNQDGSGTTDGTQKIGINNVGEHGKTVIDAFKAKKRGVLNANYWAWSEKYTDDDGKDQYGGETLARIVRTDANGNVLTSETANDEGDYYSIDGNRFMYDGLVVCSIHIDRQIGGSIKPETRAMQFYRTDLSYGDSNTWVNPYAGGENLSSFYVGDIKINVHVTYDPYGFGIPFAVTYSVDGRDDKVTIILGTWKKAASGSVYFEVSQNPVVYTGQSLNQYFIDNSAEAGSRASSELSGRVTNADNYVVTYNGAFNENNIPFTVKFDIPIITLDLDNELDRDRDGYDGAKTYARLGDGNYYWYQWVDNGTEDDPNTPQNEACGHWEIYRDTDGDRKYDERESTWLHLELNSNRDPFDQNKSNRDFWDANGNIVSIADWNAAAWNRNSNYFEDSGVYESTTQTVTFNKTVALTSSGSGYQYVGTRNDANTLVGKIYSEIKDPNDNTNALYDKILSKISFSQSSRLILRNGRYKPNISRTYATGLSLDLKDFDNMTPREAHTGQAMDAYTPNPIFKSGGMHVYPTNINSSGYKNVPGHLTHVGLDASNKSYITGTEISSIAKSLPAAVPPVSGPTGVFTPTSVLQGQAVFSFRGDDIIDTLVIPDSKGRLIKYRYQEDLGNQAYKMKADQSGVSDIIVDLQEDNKVIVRSVNAGEEPLVINLGDKTMIAQIRGAEIQGAYEVSEDVYGNKIMLVDFENKVIKEGSSLKAITNIVTAIKEFLEEKMNAVGLVPDKVRAALNNFSGIDKFVKWLTQMGGYVINCAIKAMQMMLTKAGIKVGVEELAVDTILLDLLDGNLTPKTTAILYSTFSTIEKVTKDKGLDLKTMYITKSQLENITTPVIAHVGGDHAVIVTGVYKDEVYVIESDGKLYNVPIGEFLQQWSGFVLAARAPPMASPKGPEASVPQVNPVLSGPVTPDIEKEFASPYVPTQKENLTPEAIEKRIESALIAGSPREKTQILVTGSEPFTTDKFGNKVYQTSFDSENGTLDILTTIGSDGSLSYIKSWVDYQYDEDGRLIGASGGSVAWGEDIFGNSYVTTSVDIYLILAGQAKKIKTDSVTQSESLDGSISTNTSVMNYEYTDGTEDPATLPPEYSDENGKVLIGLLKHADGNGVTIGSDVFGSTYTTTAVDTYKVIKGEAKIEKNISDTESQTISGTINKSRSIVEYFYTDGAEDPATLPPEYIDKDGKVLVGLLKDVSGNSQASSEDVFGNRYTTTTTDTYIIIDNKPKVLVSDSITTSINLDGLVNINKARIEYLYSTEKNPYINPNTDRSGRGILIGGNGSNIITGEDVFGNKFTTTTTNVYSITLNGQPKVATATSLIIMENLDGSIKREESFLNYEYTDGTEDASKLPPEYSKNGKVWIGLLKDTRGTSNTYGEDAFGNKYTTSSVNHYTYRKGELFVDRVDTTTISEDAFGNSSTTTSWVKYSYGSLIKGEKGALRNADFVMLGAEGGSLAEGSDVYGASYFTTTTNIYIFNKGQVYVDRVDSLTKGSDAFGTSYTTTTVIDYEYGSLAKGEKGALRDANFILIGATGGNNSEGADIFGSVYSSTTTNIYTYYKGQVYVDRANTVNTGSDLFGSIYTTTSFVDYDYGALKKGEKGALRDAEFVLIGAAGEAANVTNGIFGDVTTSLTKNGYKMVRGQALVETADVTTIGTNLFGENYTTTSSTIYKYYEDAPGPHGVYGELKTADSISETTGNDIWGAIYATTSTTLYKIINNRAFAERLQLLQPARTFLGNNILQILKLPISIMKGKQGLIKSSEK